MPKSSISENGKLVIESIIENTDKIKILEYLKNLFKNASEEKLTHLLNQVPSVLITSVAPKIGEKIISDLKKLGVNATFISKSKTEPKTKLQENDTFKILKQVIPKTEIQKEFLHLFQEDFPNLSTSFLYKIGLLTVTLALILLPLAYISMIGGIIYGIYWYMTSNIPIFSSVQQVKVAVILYLTPAIAGIVLILFMIKPIFAPKFNVHRAYMLDAKKESVLFNFIKRIAEVLGAPVPSEIYVDTNVNATASFENGSTDFFNPKLKLTIGLPLAGGLNIHQFIGVIAHELGHFSQSFGMRFYLLIHSINNWFARVVYERDEWDERLKRLKINKYYILLLMIWTSQGFIWLTRGILWSMMKLGRLISLYMLRQMEFNADRYEITLSGSNTFISTSKRIALLTQSYNWAFNDLDNIHEEGKLVDNFPGLIIVRANQTSSETRKEIERITIDEARAGFWDTHPSPNERIFKSQKANEPSRLKTGELKYLLIKAKELIDDQTLKDHYDGIPPASLLFSDFHEIACNVSYQFYRARLGEKIVRKKFESIKNIIKKNDIEADCNRAIDHFMKGQFSTLRPIGLTHDRVISPENLEVFLQRFNLLKEKIASTSREYNGYIKQFSNLHNRFIELSQAKILVESKIIYDPKEFNLTAWDIPTITNARQRAQQTLNTVTQELERIEENVSHMVCYALGLIFLPSMNEAVKNMGAVKETAQKFLQAANQLERQYPSFEMLEIYACQIHSLSYAYSKLPNKDVRLLEKTNQLKGIILNIFKEIKPALDTFPYPFDHQIKGISLGDYLIDGGIPEDTEPHVLMNITYDILRKVYRLYARIIGRLVYIAVILVEIASGDTKSVIPMEVISMGTDEEPDYNSEADIAQQRQEYKSFLREAMEMTRIKLGFAPRSFSILEKVYNHIRPPFWMSINSPLQCIYRDQGLLFKEGKIVWGQIIQANILLFEESSDDCPAAILYSMHPSIDENSDKLLDIAEKLYKLKGGGHDNKELNQIAQVITDEETILMNYYIPKSATGSIDVFYSTIMVHRKHLPMKRLNSNWFPLLIHPSKTKAAIILPSKYWDAEMVQIWCQ